MVLQEFHDPGQSLFCLSFGGSRVDDNTDISSFQFVFPYVFCQPAGNMQV